MSEICAREDGNVARRAVDLLALAAAPTFAVMAVLTSAFASPNMLCSAAMPLSPLNEMAVMYLLMSAFHSASWLKRIAGSPTRR